MNRMTTTTVCIKDSGLIRRITTAATLLLLSAILTLTGCQTLQKIDWNDPLVQVGISVTIQNTARFGTTFALEYAKASIAEAETLKGCILTAAAYLNDTPGDQVLDAYLKSLLPEKYAAPLGQAIDIVRAFQKKYAAPPEQVKDYLMLALANALVGCNDYIAQQTKPGIRLL